VDYLERRERGRINATQQLSLRTESAPTQSYNAVSTDVSEDNIGFTTEAKLSLGEHVKLELTTPKQSVVINAVVLRNINNLYGCKFVDENNATIFAFEPLPE
jgi:hypothetical protein